MTGRRNVAIVGGSAAGLFTARLLAQGGAAVRLYEGAGSLDPTARTLIVTSRMRDLLGPVGERSVVNEIRRIELFTDGRSAAVELQRPDLVVERGQLIRDLAVDAEAAGATLMLGRRLVDLQPQNGGFGATFSRAGTGRIEVAASISTIVGADGAFSQVARKAGWPSQPTVPLVQAIVDLPYGTPVDAARVWFIPEDTPYFYWLIPESPRRGVIGLIGQDADSIRGKLERFMARRGFAPREFQAARIPRYTGWIPIRRRLGRGDVYLVGDAGGHVKVTTVGGIVTGFRAAFGVAQAIANGGSSRELRALRRELNLHLLVRRVLHGFSQGDYSRLLDLLNETTRDELGAYTRDEADRILLRVCRSQPGLLLLALRELISGALRRPSKPAIAPARSDSRA